MSSVNKSPWVEKYSEKHKKPYWKHKNTGETVWKNPNAKSAKSDTKPSEKTAKKGEETLERDNTKSSVSEPVTAPVSVDVVDVPAHSKPLQSLPDVANGSDTADISTDYVLTPFELCQYINKLENLSNSPNCNQGFWMYVTARDDNSSVCGPNNCNSNDEASVALPEAPEGGTTTSSQMFSFRTNKPVPASSAPMTTPVETDAASFAANVFFVQLHWHHSHVNEYCLSYMSYDFYKAKFPNRPIYDVDCHFEKPKQEGSSESAVDGVGAGVVDTANVAGSEQESDGDLKAAPPTSLVSANINRLSKFFSRSKSVDVDTPTAVDVDESAIRLGNEGSFVLCRVSNLANFDKASGKISDHLVAKTCVTGCSLHVTETSIIPSVHTAGAVDSKTTPSNNSSEQELLDKFDHMVVTAAVDGDGDGNASGGKIPDVGISAAINFSATKIVNFIPLDNNNVISLSSGSGIGPKSVVEPVKSEGEPADGAGDAAAALDKLKNSALCNDNLTESFVDAITACTYLCKLFAASSRELSLPQSASDPSPSLLVANMSGSIGGAESIFVGLKKKYLHRHKPTFSGIDSVIEKALGPSNVNSATSRNTFANSISINMGDNEPVFAGSDHRFSGVSLNGSDQTGFEPEDGMDKDKELPRYSYRSNSMRFNSQSGSFETVENFDDDGDDSRPPSMRYSSVYDEVCDSFLQPDTPVEQVDVDDKPKKNKGMLHKLRKMTSFGSLKDKSPAGNANDGLTGRISSDRIDRPSDENRNRTTGGIDRGGTSPSRNSLQLKARPRSGRPVGQQTKDSVDLKEYYDSNNKYRNLSPYSKRPEPVIPNETGQSMAAPVASPRHPSSTDKGLPSPSSGIGSPSARMAPGSSAPGGTPVGVTSSTNPYGDWRGRTGTGTVKRMYAVPGGSSIASSSPNTAAPPRPPPPRAPTMQQLVPTKQPEANIESSNFPLSHPARSPVAQTTPASVPPATPDSDYVGAGRAGTQDVDMSERSDNVMYALYEPGTGAGAEIVQLAFTHNGAVAKRKCNGVRIASTSEVFVALKLKDVFDAEYDQTATGSSATGLFRLKVRSKDRPGQPSDGKDGVKYLVLQCVCPKLDGSGYDNAAVYDKLRGWLSLITKYKSEYLKKHASPSVPGTPGRGLSFSVPTSPAGAQLPISPGIGSPEAKHTTPIRIHYSEKVIPNHAPPEVVETLKRSNSMMPFYHAKKLTLEEGKSESPPKMDSPSRREAQGFVYDRSNYASTITEHNPTHVSKHNRNVSPSNRAKALYRAGTSTTLGGSESPGMSLGAAARAEELSLSPSGYTNFSGTTTTSRPLVGADGQPISRNPSPGVRARAKARESSESGASPVISTTPRRPSPPRPKHILKTGTVAVAAAPPEAHPLTDVLHNSSISHTYDPKFVNLTTLENVDSSLVVGAKGKKKYQEQLYSTLYKINPVK